MKSNIKNTKVSAPKKILICIPSYTKMDASFVQSLMGMDKPGQCSIHFITNTLIDEARNTFAEEAVDKGFDYVFFMDTDMTFPSDALSTLLSDNVDIVSGLYFRRVFPYNPLIYRTLEINDNEFVFEDFGDAYEKDSLQKIAGCGAGCLLIKTSVLKNMIDNEVPPFTMISGIGEDFSFCLRANKMGYDIYCDSRIKCGHIASFEINEDNYKYLKNLKKE